MNSSVLTLQLDWLLADVTFEFVVTVYKDVRKFTTFQVLYMDTEEPHL